jgi:hypothetical protein
VVTTSLLACLDLDIQVCNALCIEIIIYTDIRIAALTSAFLHGDTSFKLRYTPIFTNLYQQRLTAPVFSVALRRDGIGYLAMGGLPPVPHGGRWASTPIVVSKIGYIAFVVLSPTDIVLLICFV